MFTNWCISEVFPTLHISRQKSISTNIAKTPAITDNARFPISDAAPATVNNTAGKNRAEKRTKLEIPPLNALPTPQPSLITHTLLTATQYNLSISIGRHICVREIERKGHMVGRIQQIAVQQTCTEAVRKDARTRCRPG